MAIRCGVTNVVPVDAAGCASEDRIRSIGSLVCTVKTEQTRAPADDIVLSEPAVDEVVATVGLDIIVTVGCRFRHVEVKRFAGVRIRRNLSVIDEDDLPGHGRIVVVIGANEAVTLQQVWLGKWAGASLPESAEIGVNDTGAIAYFSSRTTFDVVGNESKFLARKPK